MHKIAVACNLRISLQLVFFFAGIFISNFVFSQPNNPGTEIIPENCGKNQNSISKILNPGFAPQLKFPWVGGMNSCQFCSIDLNLDGINDLLVFDRHGNRKLTFLNHGTPHTIDYALAPAFSEKIPELHDWVITADYNCDGKLDLFTYGYGGVRVFKNVSETKLEFKLVTNLLESFYYSGYVGILVTSVDYPALADIDGDGDLDLLTFFGLGSYVEYHKNLSMEKFGNCDSLDFKLTDPCWGKFKESEGGNKITLNAPCHYEETDLGSTDRISKTVNPNSRHTGSTMLATDINNDGLKDLILGDIDYPGLIAIYNGGTIDSAFIVDQDTVFPAGSEAVKLFSFPMGSLLDMDNDGLEDLVVSPFDPSLYTSENFNCAWFYKNTGTTGEPHFEFQTNRFFRSEMMDFGSSSHPVLYDFNVDGLPDLFIGNEGYYDSSYYHNTILHSVYTSKIAYFINTGTIAAPVFKYITDDLAGISSLHLRGSYPTFGDLDEDGLPDLLIGNSDGTLIFFHNTATGTVIPEFDTPVINWQGINVGNNSAPQLFDLNKDGKSELVIGEKKGNLNYYVNNGSNGNPLFEQVTDSLGKINVTNYNLSYDGYSTPCFFRLTDGTTFLLCGSNEGRVHLYENIDNNLSGTFTHSDSLFEWLSATPADTLFGWQTSPAIAPLSDPTLLDMVIGNFSGGLNYITKRSPAEIIPGIKEAEEQNTTILQVFPNPADQAVTIRSLRSINPATSTTTNRNNLSNIFIYNLFAQKIQEIPFTGSVTISTTNLPPGIYLIRYANITAKMIINHP